MSCVVEQLFLSLHAFPYYVTSDLWHLYILEIRIVIILRSKSTSDVALVLRKPSNYFNLNLFVQLTRGALQVASFIWQVESEQNEMYAEVERIVQERLWKVSRFRRPAR